MKLPIEENQTLLSAMISQPSILSVVKILSILTLFAGCATVPQQNVQEVKQVPKTIELKLEAEGVAFMEDAGQLSKFVIPNWDRFAEATGHGFPSEDATNPVMKKMTALAAARYRALAEMVEALEGMHVERESQVENMVFAGEQVSISLSGVVKGATTVSETYNAEEESAEVVIRVAMDKDGKLIPNHANSLAPVSLYKRRAEAEEAAKVNASAALRERLGDSYLMQRVVVKDLRFKSQEAESKVEGLLEQVTFSKPEWIENTKCVVTASVTLDVKNPEYRANTTSVKAVADKNSDTY